jgi:hypothetical protein
MTTAHKSVRVGVPLRRGNVDVIALAAVAAVLLQYTYVLAYNHAPESVRTAFAGALLAIHVALAAFSLGQRPQTWQTAILLSIAMTIASWLVTHGINTGSKEFQIADSLRVFSLYVMPLWLLAFPRVIPHRLLIALAVGSTLIGAIVGISHPPMYPSYEGGRGILASFTGGVTQRHPNPMFIALQLVMVHEYYRAGIVSRLVAWPMILFCFVLIAVGYQGRNEMVFVGAYFATLGYYRYRAVPAIRWSPPILLVLFVITFAAALSVGHDVQDWGSGRIGVWQYRLGLIWHRDLLTFLFGGGLGSDFIWSGPVWKFMGNMPAHNDYLHIMMENGSLGLVAAFVFLAGLFMRLPGSSKSVLVGLVVSSFFSNGLLQSTLLAMNFFILAAVAFYIWHVRYAQGRTDSR